jgi:tetratricopeptide (TPR) repeat protein
VLIRFKIRILASQKETSEVPALFRQLIEINPEKVGYIQQWVGFTMADESIPEDQRAKIAEEIFREQIARRPEDDEIKLGLVQFLAKTNSIDEGMKTLEEFVQSSPESESLRNGLAKAYLSTENMDRAKAIYTEIIDKDPTSVDAINARMKLAGIAFSVNDKDEAKRLIAEVLAIDAENSEALILKSRISMLKRQYSDAIPDLRVVLKNNPDSEPALLLMAIANQEIGSTDLALDAYQTLLVLKPDHVAALTGVARILQGRGDIERAQKLLEAAIKEDPDNPEAARLLVTIYGQQQEWDKALSLCAQVIENEQTIALGYYLQGRIYLGQRDTKAAIKSLEQSQLADDRIVESLSALIQAYVASGQQDVAIKYLVKHIEKNPEHLNARELLASVYANAKEYDKSVSLLTAVIEDASGKHKMQAYKQLAKVYAVQGDNDAINKLLENGIKNNPGIPGLYMLQAEFYQQTGEIDKAIVSYESLLAMSPDVLMAKNNLASLLLDFRLTEANLERAAELSSELGATEVPAFLDTAGWVQYQLENYPQALALIQLAVDKGGNTAVYQYHLGMAYFKNNMPEDAKEALTLAVSVEGQYPGKDEAQKVLDTL